ncbi:MAG: proprotein convertase P-domain-containing protein [Methylothermaceae bacterium]|nr:proprotein convertase P-domain-containing protein [Methylothermaceae bacterium]
MVRFRPSRRESRRGGHSGAAADEWRAGILWDSSPDRSIPDNNARGIKDKIASGKDFAVGAVRVGAEITHTYIGDLRVTLTSPAGTSVALHDRAGGSANDLHADFDGRSVPGLLALSGEPVTGEWVLQVQDLAPVDRGRLKSWSLDVTGKADASITVEESPGIFIPDDVHGGIERTLTVSESGRLEEIEVDLDITHTYIGDLVVELVSPDNTSVLLHTVQAVRPTTSSRLYPDEYRRVAGHARRCDRRGLKAEGF